MSHGAVVKSLRAVTTFAITHLSRASILHLVLSSVTVCRPAGVAKACRADVHPFATTHESDMADHESPYTMASAPDLGAQSKSTTVARAVPVMKASLFHGCWYSFATL